MVWLSVLGLFLVLAALPFPFARAGRVMAQPQPPQAPPVFAGDITGQGIIPGALLTPTPGVIVTDPQVTFDWANATTDDPGGIISYTLLITGANTTREITTVTSIHTTTLTANGPYTWTVQAYDANGGGDYAPPATFTLDAGYRVFLPIINKPECPSTSSASFDLIPFNGPAADHPDYMHGDLNLALRGYNAVNEAKNLVDYSGGTDPQAPQLAGLFAPNDFPGISAVYQVNDWNWNCGEHGCRGPALTSPSVTLAGLVTSKGQALYIPERSPDIYGGGYKAVVLYAEEKRITLNYTREDTVANGYTVHIENICVDPNLLALYRAQTNSEGYHQTGALPALRNNQALGTALNAEIQVAIRDRGMFMDPRSRKDWWPGY